MKFDIREPVEGDIGWIYNTWITSWTKKTKFQHIDKNWLRSATHSMCTKIMLDPKTEVKVACDPSDHENNIGYIVYSDGVLHWIYVKYSFRGLGIGSALFNFIDVDEGPVKCTHWTNVLNHLTGKWKLVRDSSPLTKVGRNEL